MPPGHERNGSSAYRPTSLDFINLPNPIQPAPPSQRHPLNGTPQLEKARLENASSQDLFRLVLDPPGGRSSKRPRPVENPHLDLPKLPVRTNAKRLRIPPTLSGLHQPPPDAGLLPSISIEQPTNPPPRPQEVDLRAEGADRLAATRSNSTSNPSAAHGPKKQPKKPAKRNKWTAEETEFLLKGVSRFGVGNWTRIWNCSDYRFNNRTALDLKDRFRVCFPDHNKKSNNSSPPSRHGGTTSTDTDDQPLTTKRSNKGPASERVNPSTLEKLGINEPFVKSERRARHGYSAAEDEALLKGFKKHGKAWTTIRLDPDLNLSTRQATDLRDRMRTRFPEDYAKAGLAPRAKKQSNSDKRGDDEVADDIWATKASMPKQPGVEARENTQQIINSSMKHTQARRPHQQALFSLDDVYLGQLSDEEDAEHERITLDRGILDWPTDTARPAPAETLRPPDINLPPMHAPDPPLSQGGQGNGTTALPSLASLLPENNPSEHFELPSLTEWWGPNDGRSGGSSFPSLEDILSRDI